jgi:hypothetical protein
VNARPHTIALVLALTSSAQPLLAADEVAPAVPVAKDLTAVIALQGLPCGQVVRVTQKAENNYVATCQDGNRYHVLVDPSGRVVVQKQ